MSVLYWRYKKIGTKLLALIPAVSKRSGVVQGLDQKVATPVQTNPNFEWAVEASVMFFSASWRRPDLHAALQDALTGIIDEQFVNPVGPLCWVDDETKTTTTSNAETAGSAVQIEVVSVAALDVVANDYVLLINSTDQIGQLAKVTAKDGSSITVDVLDEDLDAGSTVLKVFQAYPDCAFVSADTGRPTENSEDAFRFSTSWRFLAGGNPVRSTAP